MSDRYPDDRDHLAHGAHGAHDGCLGIDSRIQRAALTNRHRSRRRHGKTDDAEREAMRREIAELRAALFDVTGVLRQMHAQRTANTSVLDEMMRSLEAKEPVIKDIEIPKSLVVALSGAYDDD
jgi:hypothetical protein